MAIVKKIENITQNWHTTDCRSEKSSRCIKILGITFFKKEYNLDNSSYSTAKPDGQVGFKSN